MAHYKVKATIEVEYDAEYISKMAIDLKETENSILTTLLKHEVLSPCKFKDVEVQLKDY